MKAIFTFTIIVVLMIVAAQEASAQGVAINENGAAPDPSAMLDVQSTEKGVLVPRMSQAQRDAIPSPATGLLIYQTDNEPGFYFNAGTPGSPFWQGISGSEGGSGQWNNNANMIYYDQGNVGIGFNAPPARITAIGNFGNPSIPGFASSGIARFGIIPQEAIDIGKKIAPPHTGWIQAGFNGDIADPLALNPVGGNIGIGTSNPIALLHAVGNDTGQGNVLFEGSFKSSNPGSPPAEGAGTRMMWYPDRSAFRVGRVTGDHWDHNNIGGYSIALGYNNMATSSHSTSWGFGTMASGTTATAWGSETNAWGSRSTAWGRLSLAEGPLSTAWGEGTEATANRSTAWGEAAAATSASSTAWGVRTIASGLQSTAWGYESIASANTTTAWGSGTVASGLRATAFGFQAEASGQNATAWGVYTTAPSYGETVIGRYNTEYTPANSIAWNTGDRLFVIGNGTASNRRDALIVYKTGRMETYTPTNTKAIRFRNDFASAGGNIDMFNQHEKRTVRINGTHSSNRFHGNIQLYDGVDESTARVNITANWDNSGKSRIVIDQLQILGGSDLAEHFDIVSKHVLPMPGMVVSIDPEGTGKLVISDIPYDKRVAGIISGANGIDPGMVMSQTGSIADGEYPVSLTGRVFVYVSDEGGEIMPGDLLTTSSKPGFAMKATDNHKAIGATIGKAMSGVDENGFVLLLVNLH